MLTKRTADHKVCWQNFCCLFFRQATELARETANQEWVWEWEYREFACPRKKSRVSKKCFELSFLWKQESLTHWFIDLTGFKNLLGLIKDKRNIAFLDTLLLNPVRGHCRMFRRWLLLFFNPLRQIGGGCCGRPCHPDESGYYSDLIKQ